MIKNKAEKTLKYKDLTIDIQCMWNVKAKVIPLIMGQRTISKSFQQCLSNILGKHKIKELQMSAMLDTAHVLRKVLI